MTGIVCWWPFAIVDIPNGWHLCDGTNGTPDYQNFVLIGAGDLYVPGQVLGSLTHSHTGNAQHDAHDHVASSSQETVTLDDSTSTEGDTLGDGDIINDAEPDGDIDKETVEHSHDVNFESELHNHTITVNPDGHTHTVITSTDGHLPPCKAGCWIMKL